MRSKFAQSLEDLKERFGLLYAWKNDHASGIRVHVRFLGPANYLSLFFFFKTRRECLLTV